MAYEYQFVDSISEMPTVRLDLVRPVWRVIVPTNFDPPMLRRAGVMTLLRDGEAYPASAYQNRTISLVARIMADTDDAVAVALQQLWRELDRPNNILRYKPGTSEPVFFKTFRAGPDSVTWDEDSKLITAEIPAEPFAYGLPESTGTLTVYNDPGLSGSAINANPNFETNANSWSGVGGTVARSTAQAHEGSASLLLTPDGVTATVEARSENIAVAVGQRYRASAWVRCSASRNVSLVITWLNALGNVNGDAQTLTISVTANIWTLFDFERSAPDLPGITTQARIAVQLGSTPSAGTLTYIDEAQLRQVGAGDGMYVDLPDIKGDVETPLRITIPQGGDVVDDGQMAMMAIRRRGTPSGTPFVLQAESLTQGGGTTTQANSSSASGPGNNYSRCTFSGVDPRLSSDVWPLMDTPDVRGRYRVLARIRTTVADDVIYGRIRWGLTAYTAGLPEVPLGFANGVGTTIWRLADLGLISFPAGADPEVDGLTGLPLPARGQFLRFDARLESGSGNLDIDYFVFVPADDRLAVVAWGGIENPEGGEVVIDGITETVYGIKDGVVYGGGIPPSITGWMYASPGVANRLFWLRSVSPVVADNVTSTTQMTIEYLPRYLYVQPPEESP